MNATNTQRYRPPRRKRTCKTSGLMKAASAVTRRLHVHRRARGEKNVTRFRRAMLFVPRRPAQRNFNLFFSTVFMVARGKKGWRNEKNFELIMEKDGRFWRLGPRRMNWMGF